MKRPELVRKKHLRYASELRSDRRDAITAVSEHAHRVHVTEFQQQMPDEFLL